MEEFTVLTHSLPENAETMTSARPGPGTNGGSCRRTATCLLRRKKKGSVGLRAFRV